MSAPAPLAATVDESPLIGLLRGVALAAAAAAATVDLALPGGTVGVVVAALLAAFVGGRLGRGRARLPAIWLGAVVAVLLSLGAARLVVDLPAVATALGTRRTMALADVIRFGLLVFAGLGALRATARRFPIAALVELAFVAAAFAGLVAQHRDGAINHPRALSDWALLHGRDPGRLLLALGAAATVALAVAAAREQRGRGARVVLHLAVVALVAALVLQLIRLLGLPMPPSGQGLTKEGPARPRDGAGSGGQGGGGGRRNDQVSELQFRDDYSSSTENAPVAVVLLQDDYAPPMGYYYFRQTAFSQYNGHRLVSTTRDDVDLDVVTDLAAGPVDVPAAPKPGRERRLIHTTVALLAAHVRPFGLESPTRFEPRPSPDPARFQRVYEVSSAALSLRYEELIGRRAGATALGSGLPSYRELPADPRYRELADRIVEQVLKPQYRRDPFAQAVAISAWLGKQSTYSMRSQHASATDPTADFLFGDRVGYCVHFAHAAAFLLRARGLPARIAAGYIADEGRRRSGSTILLRQKDAHAWAELWLDGFGWIIVDVAPERTLDPPDTPPDPELQRLLGELARGDPHGGKLVAKHEPLGPLLARLGRLLLLALALLVALAYLVKLWRAVAPLWAGPSSVHRLAYRATLDRLAEAGVERRVGETRERFAARGESGGAFVDLTRGHVAAAFGGRSLPSVGEVRELARRSRRGAWGRAPRWRIVLGLVDPTVWLRVR